MEIDYNSISQYHKAETWELKDFNFLKRLELSLDFSLINFEVSKFVTNKFNALNIKLKESSLFILFEQLYSILIVRNLSTNLYVKEVNNVKMLYDILFIYKQKQYIYLPFIWRFSINQMPY